MGRDRYGPCPTDGVTIRTGTTSEGQPYYREELAGFDDVGSLLVALRPDTGDRGSVWAVLRSGTDPTPGTEADVFVWELELTVLRRYEGEDRSEIEDEFGDEVL